MRLVNLFRAGQVPAAPMQEAPLRMLPQGVVIRGETTRGVGAMRLAAVFAVLVSLLAVACVVLMQPSAGAVGGKRTTELSLDTAMSTFFKNTAEHEERLAAAQALEMQHLAAVKDPSTAAGPAQPRPTHPSAPPAVPSMRRPSKSTPPATQVPKYAAAPRAGAERLPVKPRREKQADGPELQSSRRLRKPDVGSAVERSTTKPTRMHQEPAQTLDSSPREVTMKVDTEKAGRSDVARMSGRVQGLASVQTLDNQPWTAPASDFGKSSAPHQSPAASKNDLFDFAVPQGTRPGESFLVKIAGHRERKVTVPAGVKPGQLVSIDVPAAQTSKLGQETAAEVEADSAEQAGKNAAVESSLEPSKDFSTSPVVFGDSAEQQSAATAVNAVHDLFAQREAPIKKWVPGDTQPIPQLEPLGQTSQDKWTSDSEVYGDLTALHTQSCAARCGACKTMGAGNWYCQRCGDVCDQVYATESRMFTHTWKPGDPEGAVDPLGQLEVPQKFFKAVTAGQKQDYMEQPMLPAKKRWYQKTTQITHVHPGGVSQISSNREWPVQAVPSGLSALAGLYAPGGSPSNLPTLSSLATIEGRAYKASLMQKKQQKQLLQEEAAPDEQAPAEEKNPPEGEDEVHEQEGVQAKAEKTPGFIVASPDDQGPVYGTRRTGSQKSTVVNVMGPGGPIFVQNHRVPAENPQHFGAYLKPNFHSEYPTTQTITVNPTRPVMETKMVSDPAAPQMSYPQQYYSVPRPSTSIVNTYQPAAVAAKQQAVQTSFTGGGLMFQVPPAPGVAIQPGLQASAASSTNKIVTEGWGGTATTVNTVKQRGPAEDHPGEKYAQYETAPPASASITTAIGGAGAIPAGSLGYTTAPSTIQVVNKAQPISYESLAPIPELKAMPFFDTARRHQQALFRHWDGKEMKVLNVLPIKGGEVNLDPENWQGQNMVIAEGKKGQSADKQFSEAMMQVTQGLHAAANSELHYKGGDRTGVTYREYGDVNPAIGEPVDPTRGQPKLAHADPFGLKAREVKSPFGSINERAGAVPTGSAVGGGKETTEDGSADGEAVEGTAAGTSSAQEKMIVKVPPGLKPGQSFVALTGAHTGQEERVTVPPGVKAGGEVEINGQNA